MGAIGLGVFSVACATGAFETQPTNTVEIEPVERVEGPGVVNGIVRDAETGEAIAGAVMVLQCSCLEGTREAESNVNGVYVFRDLPRGTYTLQALWRENDVSKIFNLPDGAKMRANFSLTDGPRRIIT